MMKKYLIVHEIDDYADNGGGTKVKIFESKYEVEKYITEEANGYNGLKSTFRCFEIKKEFELKKFEKTITKYEVIE